MIHSSRAVVASVFLSHPVVATQLLSDVLWRASIRVFSLELVPAQILFLIKCGALFSKVTTFLTDVNENSVCYARRPCHLLLWISFRSASGQLFSAPRLPLCRCAGRSDQSASLGLLAIYWVLITFLVLLGFLRHPEQAECEQPHF